ncbi:MAG: alpha/beta fold hydrolase [Acidimicrobiales bacterium]
MIFRFEEAELDTAAFELRMAGDRVPLEPQVFEVLSYLVQHRDRLVARTELLDVVWGDRFVSDSALATRVAAARAAVGDDGRTQRLIRTVHGRGLQFVGDVVVGTDSLAASAPTSTVAPAGPSTAPPARHPTESSAEPAQTVRFARADDGTELAVATIGEGRPLVKTANWLTHVEKDRNGPVWGHWTNELGARFRYLRYDSRGCGLSDRDLRGAALSDIETWVGDLETVVDGNDLDRFVLFGMSQGGAPALAYAVRYPERVSHLVLLGGYSRGMKMRGPEERAEADVYVEMIRTGWGGRNPAFRSFFTTTFLPDATSAHVRWFNELQAETTDTENAMLFEQAFHEHDFSELAGLIEVPTLVVHARDDLAVPYAEGRRLASLIPGAEFVTLDSANHILMADEPAWPEFLGHLDRFTADDHR